MSRTRKERGSVTSSEEVQLWHTLRAHLRTLDKLQSTSKTDLETLDARRTRYIENNSWSSTSAAADERRDALLSAYKHFDARCLEEQSEIDRALEKLSLLIALRDGNTDEVSKRKKRRTESDAVSYSSSLDRQGSPLSVDDSFTAAPESRKRSSTKASASGSAAPAMSTSLSSSGQLNKDHIDSAKARREVLAHQLPLQKGRKVVFRQPSKNKTGPGAANTGTVGAGLGPNGLGSSTRGAAAAASNGASATAEGEEEGETWIMVTVIECINNDRNRYVVQDEEDAAMPKYNTTLKAIVPLPESLQTLPQEDYKVGTEVLALYPDTSCFYRATVLSGGPGLTGARITQKQQRRADEILATPYRLRFEDDGTLVQSVPANLVVERP